ncbi:MAG: hypothetical protein ACREJ3_02105, partial [Polyangiaceae bacterium]
GCSMKRHVRFGCGVAVFAVLTAGCGGSALIPNDASAPDATPNDAAANAWRPDGGVDAGDSGSAAMFEASVSKGDAADTSLSGPCMEGMRCAAYGSFDCTCQSGSWHCADGGAPPTPLPVRDPTNGDRCNVPYDDQYGCSLPDHCGSACACGVYAYGWWQCRAILGIYDGGLPITGSVPDAGQPNSVDAGCFLPICPSLSCPSSPTMCLTLGCSASFCGPGLPGFPFVLNCYMEQ